MILSPLILNIITVVINIIIIIIVVVIIIIVIVVFDIAEVVFIARKLEKNFDVLWSLMTSSDVNNDYDYDDVMTMTAMLIIIRWKHRVELDAIHRVSNQI